MQLNYFIKIICHMLIISIFITCLGCAGKIISPESQKKMKIISAAEKLSESPVWENRLNAVRIACRNVNKEMINRVDKIILTSLKDIHPAVRIEALSCIKKMPLPQYFSHVLSITKNDKNSNVRWYGLLALAEYRKAELAPVFINYFKSRDWIIRKASIIGLLRIKDVRIQYKSIGTIIKALRDKSPSVVIATLTNISIKHKSIHKEIDLILKRNFRKSRTITKACLKALNGYELGKATREKVILLLTDLNKETRILAYRVLKKEEMIRKLKGKTGE